MIDRSETPADLDLLWSHLTHVIGRDDLLYIAFTFLTEDADFGHAMMVGPVRGAAPDDPRSHAATTGSVPAIMSFLADANARYWDTRMSEER